MVLVIACPPNSKFYPSKIKSTAEGSINSSFQLTVFYYTNYIHPLENHPSERKIYSVVDNLGCIFTVNYHTNNKNQPYPKGYQLRNIWLAYRATKICDPLYSIYHTFSFMQRGISQPRFRL